MVEQPAEQQQTVPAIRYGWLRAALFLIVAFISSSIFSIVGVIVLALAFNIDMSVLMTDARNLIQDLGLPANIVLTLFGFTGMVMAAWIFRKFIDKKSFKSLGFDFVSFRKDFLIGLFLGFILISIGFLILYSLGEIVVVDVSFSPALISGYILFFCIGSLNEEIMIRGYFLSNFCDSMNKYIALFISSLVFALMHLGNANVTLISFINIFLAGMLLGIYYIHKRNLWLPISLHFSWNFFQGAVFGFEVSGVGVSGIIVQETSTTDIWTGGAFGFEGSLIATILMIIAIAILHLKYKNSFVNAL